MDKGILVATDVHTEWLLPWWWKYYSRYNDLPVALVDWGLSEEMRIWASSRFQLVAFQEKDRFVVSKNKLSDEKIRAWEADYLGDVWVAREAWFKKPLACLQSPFDVTLWVDTDCEVCGSLNPLFEKFETDCELAIVNDERVPGVANYSSGVMLFRKESSFLQAWANLCLTASDKFMGDQNALTELIVNDHVNVQELDKIYNWIMYQGVNPSAVIAHWGAAWGKEYIRKHGGLHTLLERA